MLIVTGEELKTHKNRAFYTVRVIKVSVAVPARRPYSYDHEWKGLMQTSERQADDKGL